MKFPILAAAAALAACAAQASVFDFGTLSAGDLANNATSGLASFSYASLVQDTNIDGDPIPGSFTWQLDGSNGPVLVQTPSLRGHGAGPNGLDAVDQPVALIFSAPLTLSHFSGVLDHGPLGGAPIPHDLVFLNASHQVITTALIDFSTPGATFSVDNIADVAEIILPSDRYYEQLSFTAVPEVDGRMIAAGLALAGGLVLRRRKN